MPWADTTPMPVTTTRFLPSLVSIDICFAPAAALAFLAPPPLPLPLLPASLRHLSDMSALTDTKLVIENPLTGLPRALVPAIGEDGSFLLVDEYTWPLEDAGPGGAEGEEPRPGPSPSPVGTAGAAGARAPRQVRYDVGGPGGSGPASLMGVDHRGASGGPGGEPENVSSPLKLTLKAGPAAAPKSRKSNWLGRRPPTQALLACGPVASSVHMLLALSLSALTPPGFWPGV